MNEYLERIVSSIYRLLLHASPLEGSFGFERVYLCKGGGLYLEPGLLHRPRTENGVFCSGLYYEHQRSTC